MCTMFHMFIAFNHHNSIIVFPPPLLLNSVGQLQATDSNTCGYYALFFLFVRARGKSMESFIQPFKYLRDIDNDHKIGEILRKLVTHVGKKTSKVF